ncbi:MAG: glycosyl hydrolase 108 family protein, partial [Candidatus Binatia bacterium]
MQHEGEWGKVPGDLGGRTRWGISSVAHPEV